MIRILELFGGIGAIRKAFERENIPHKVIDYVEIDKYAVKSYNAMFNENFEVQDITTWNKDIDVDFIMHGSPCQDFSVAGKQAGGDLGSGTRSSLMYETIRIVGKLRPKYVMWENVKNLLSKKHKHNFDAYIETMNILGYNSYYQVLNAKDYGIPQNRERVYTISIRKDIDKGTFKFPEKEELKLKLKDMLDKEVDEKYYLNDAQIDRIHTTTYNVGKTRIQEKDYCDTLCARDWKDPKCIQIGNLVGGRWDKIYENCRRVYSEDGISPTIPTCQGGNTEPKVQTNITKEGYVEKKYNNFIKENGYVPQMFNPYNKSEINDIAPTQSTQCGSTTSSSAVLKSEGKRIRKLTPKECWRLMGFDDEDFEKAKAVPTSDTQLYKQAGNSIVVNVLEKILLNLF